MSFRFENLEIWKEARELVKKVYKITSQFPDRERFGLTDQLRRAAISVALNITEGSDRKSDKEFERFLRMSITSCEEVVTGLYIAQDLGYLNGSEFRDLYNAANQQVAKTNALIKKLKQ